LKIEKGKPGITWLSKRGGSLHGIVGTNQVDSRWKTRKLAHRHKKGSKKEGEKDRTEKIFNQRVGSGRDTGKWRKE